MKLHHDTIKRQLYLAITQGCICEILTGGGSEFGMHTDQTGKGIQCPLGGGVAAY